MTITVEQAQAALDAANKELMEEWERDAQRSGGSVRQENAREERQKNLAAAVNRCERDLRDALARKG